MADLFVLYTALTVFGAGVTVVDFLGILDHSDADADADTSDGDDFHGHAGDHGAADGMLESIGAGNHDNSGALRDKGSYIGPGSTRHDKKFRVVMTLLSLLRNAVYFSLGFGPTGLFAHFTGLPKATGFVWACAVGAVMMIFARLLKRFIRRDLDSSIKPNELLQEKGTLLLPLDGETLSKATIRQFGRETEVYVRCKDKALKLPKGKEITIVDYDEDVYWVEPVED